VASEHRQVTVRDNRDESWYEAEVDGKLGIAAYQLRGDTITFTHTEVPEELEGQGIAGQVVRFALDDARARGLQVVPRCPYVAGFIRRHPEYQDLVKAGH
jgi:predicted GNAT family acetyltransferase